MPPVPTNGFCRDCLEYQALALPRCRACGSPRIVRHPELYGLGLAHIDCDAFYAAVEKRDDPALADKPVIVGGARRGVVMTACYIARISGVRSAMPMFKALQLCPEAVVVRPDMEKYARVGRQVRSMMQDLTPLVQPVSIDEAFLDLAGTERLHGEPPARTLARLARRVESELGISFSVGLSYCKFLAKMASDLQKPRGFCVIGRAEAKSFLRARPVTAIWGVGQAFAGRLRQDGIATIGQLQLLDEGELMRRYGVIGSRLHDLSHGIDARPVDPRRAAKSVSSETTFAADIATGQELAPILRRLSERVSERLKAADLAGSTVVLKLKTADFRIRTRNRKLDGPTQLAGRIFQTGRDLMERELDGTRFRLIGIGVSDLTGGDGADPPDLLDPMRARMAGAERAMDRIRAKFGTGLLETGQTFQNGGRDRPARRPPVKDG